MLRIFIICSIYNSLSEIYFKSMGVESIAMDLAGIIVCEDKVPFCF